MKSMNLGQRAIRDCKERLSSGKRSIIIRADDSVGSTLFCRNSYKILQLSCVIILHYLIATQFLFLHPLFFSVLAFFAQEQLRLAIHSYFFIQHANYFFN